MYIFETLLIIEMYIVDADDTVCCVPTVLFPFVLIFGQVPHYQILYESDSFSAGAELEHGAN